MGRITPKVTLVRATPDAVQVVAAAAKLCYAEDTRGILHQETAPSDKFIRKLLRMGHLSPIEHAVFTFYIEGVSRAMTHQLVRHRIASYSQRSQRYVAHDCFDYVLPPQLEGKTVEIDGRKVDAVAYYAETMEMIAQRYARLNQALGRKGESSNEDARYVLPNACETKIFVSMNARELLHFFEQRLCQRAQWEIRRVADQMLSLLKETCPALFSSAGPRCVPRGGCPEGKMSCGQYVSVKQRYAPEK